MRILKTNKPDVCDDKSNDDLKMDLANKIVNKIYPLFDNQYNSKLLVIRDLKNQLNEQKKITKGKALKIKELSEFKNLLDLQNKVLTRLDQLFNLNIPIFDAFFSKNILKVLQDEERINNKEELENILEACLNLLKKKVR